jgi:uncharacterized coiled-coil DUF342 family protein
MDRLREKKRLVPEEVIELRRTVDELRKDVEKLRGQIEDVKKQAQAKAQNEAKSDPEEPSVF